MHLTHVVVFGLRRPQIISDGAFVTSADVCRHAHTTHPSTFRVEPAVAAGYLNQPALTQTSIIPTRDFIYVQYLLTFCRRIFYVYCNSIQTIWKISAPCYTAKTSKMLSEWQQWRKVFSLIWPPSVLSRWLDKPCVIAHQAVFFICLMSCMYSVKSSQNVCF